MESNLEDGIVNEIGSPTITSNFSNLPVPEYMDHHDEHYLQRMIATRISTMSENLKREEMHYSIKEILMLHMAFNQNDVSFYDSW